MKKLAYCMVMLALGMVMFAGCKKDDAAGTGGGTDVTDTGGDDTTDGGETDGGETDGGETDAGE